ncbi:TPA: replication initiation protein, partial [Photobacterium damselae]
IAKSIAKWTMTHFTPQRFSESQARKGRKGGHKSTGGGRPSLNEPWVELGISRATYFRRKKAGI